MIQGHDQKQLEVMQLTSPILHNQPVRNHIAERFTTIAFWPGYPISSVLCTHSLSLSLVHTVFFQLPISTAMSTFSDDPPHTHTGFLPLCLRELRSFHPVHLRVRYTKKSSLGQTCNSTDELPGWVPGYPLAATQVILDSLECVASSHPISK